LAEKLAGVTQPGRRYLRAVATISKTWSSVSETFHALDFLNMCGEVNWLAGHEELPKRKVVGSCECGNEPLGSIKGGKFFF